MQAFLIDGRLYQTDGKRSEVSGRLVDVRYLRDDGGWREVKNVTRCEEILNILESCA